ncbi:YbaB/EbfC family nucleoid-associated protein [Actinophytocola oryzae]|uniref:DNA-binding protein YbaB n=1 Tax=Actinophytocola oryzae TaxID=502181 RepID=A0A4R7UTU9_9PSEU|nr:YbaB/EbfC family nucleoid-associated protein [Actinophytocola oryzae]TDV40069.1 DNA-binding protein YbaB [Actinophytocola oryzae]
MERSTTELTGRFAEYQRLAEQVMAIRDGIDDIRGTGYSDDGLVTAVVGGRGRLLELEIDPRIYRERNATELAAKVVAAVREAAAEAEKAATTIAEKTLPQTRGGEDVDPVFDPVMRLLGDAQKLEGRS